MVVSDGIVTALSTEWLHSNRNSRVLSRNSSKVMENKEKATFNEKERLKRQKIVK